MSVSPQVRAVARLLRNDLARIGEQLDSIQQIFKQHTETIKAAQEQAKEQQSITRFVRAEVGFNQETRTESERQYRVQKGIRTATRFAFLAAAVYAVISWRQAHLTQQQIALLSRQLELTDRPWIKVEVTANTDYVPGALLGGPLTFDADGNGQLTRKYILKNIGKSVATGVRIRSKSFATSIVGWNAQLVVDQQRKLCHQNGSDASTEGDGEVIVFPNDVQQELEAGGFETKTLSDVPSMHLKNGKPIHVFLIGCVDYRYGSSSANHQTGFIYEVWGSRQHQGIQTKMTIPVESLTFEPFFIGGDYAY